MTIYEHVMLGVDGALTLGLHRRFGWQIVAWSGCAAALPDWDGLTLLFGARCFDAGHRLWGHNLLVAGLTALIVGAVVWRWNLLGRAARAIPGKWRGQARCNVASAGSSSLGPLWVWAIVALAAAYSHLAMDVLYSIGHDLPVWDVPLLWPFSTKGWAYPAVRWGDPVPTILFAAGMLAMARWKAATQPIALATLALVAAYIAIRGIAG